MLDLGRRRFVESPRYVAVGAEAGDGNGVDALMAVPRAGASGSTGTPADATATPTLAERTGLAYATGTVR